MTKKQQLLVGKTWRFGANISTDDIISGVHLATSSTEELAPFAFEHLRPEFAQQVQTNDIIVADQNFGIGSSREEAPAILRQLGVAAIIATSFARIFYRNAFNLGIPALEFPALAQDSDLIEDGDILEIDLIKGTLLNQRTTQKHQISKVPPFLMEYLKTGGAIPLLKQKHKLR